MTRYTRAERRAAIEALHAADDAVHAHQPTSRDSDADSEFQSKNNAAWDAARNPALPLRYRLANRWRR